MGATMHFHRGVGWVAAKWGRIGEVDRVDGCIRMRRCSISHSCGRKPSLDLGQKWVWSDAGRMKNGPMVRLRRRVGSWFAPKRTETEHFRQMGLCVGVAFRHAGGLLLRLNFLSVLLRVELIRLTICLVDY